MATKTNKTQAELLIVNRYMESLLPLFKEAVVRDEWDGLTGSKKFINNIEVFTEKKGDAAKNQAFEGFFKAITEIVISKDDKTTALKEFTKKYMDFTLQLSKKSPEMFTGENAKVAQTCKSVMDPKQKTTFEKNLGLNNKVEKDSLVNKHLGADKLKPTTFAERVIQSREEGLQQTAR